MAKVPKGNYPFFDPVLHPPLKLFKFALIFSRFYSLPQTIKYKLLIIRFLCVHPYNYQN